MCFAYLCFVDMGFVQTGFVETGFVEAGFTKKTNDDDDDDSIANDLIDDSESEMKVKFSMILMINVDEKKKPLFLQ